MAIIRTMLFVLKTIRFSFFRSLCSLPNGAFLFVFNLGFFDYYFLLFSAHSLCVFIFLVIYYGPFLRFWQMKKIYFLFPALRWFFVLISLCEAAFVVSSVDLQKLCHSFGYSHFYFVNICFYHIRLFNVDRENKSRCFVRCCSIQHRIMYTANSTLDLSAHWITSDFVFSKISFSFFPLAFRHGKWYWIIKLFGGMCRRCRCHNQFDIKNKRCVRVFVDLGWFRWTFIFALNWLTNKMLAFSNDFITVLCANGIYFVCNSGYIVLLSKLFEWVLQTFAFYQSRQHLLHSVKMCQLNGSENLLWIQLNFPVHSRSDAMLFEMMNFHYLFLRQFSFDTISRKT